MLTASHSFLSSPSGSSTASCRFPAPSVALTVACPQHQQQQHYQPCSGEARLRGSLRTAPWHICEADKASCLSGNFSWGERSCAYSRTRPACHRRQNSDMEATRHVIASPTMPSGLGASACMQMNTHRKQGMGKSVPSAYPSSSSSSGLHSPWPHFRKTMSATLWFPKAQTRTLNHSNHPHHAPHPPREQQ